MTSSPTHWDHVYQTRQPEQVSWFRPHLDVSLELLQRAGVGPDSRVIDVGAGTSTLIDDLLARDVQSLLALDISSAALQVVRDRLGPRAERVRWIVADVTALDLPENSIDIWHDRALLHFLTDPQDAAKYARVAARVIAPGGHAIVGGFASDGPEQCSQLPVVRRDPEQIAELFAGQFSLVEARREVHATPRGAPQRFAYALLRRQADRRMPLLRQPGSPEEWRQARHLIEEYAASLQVDLSFQNFAAELEHLESEYGPPGGAFLVVEDNADYVACIGLRRFADGVGEIKRLYVAPAARGGGLGRILVQQAIAKARQLGYRKLLLDTLPFMKEAQALYLSLGFKPTAAYRFNPVSGTSFLELDL